MPQDAAEPKATFQSALAQTPDRCATRHDFAPAGLVRGGSAQRPAHAACPPGLFAFPTPDRRHFHIRVPAAADQVAVDDGSDLDGEGRFAERGPAAATIPATVTHPVVGEPAPSTFAKHLEHICRKPGVSSRAAAVSRMTMAEGRYG